MSTTPIPSALVEDFKLNVEDFDAFANGTGAYTDRFGSSRLSLSQFMESIGYEVPVAFADALSITRVTQTVTYSGNTYHARADAIPFTTTVTFNAAQWDLIVSNPVDVATHAAASKATPVDADEIPLVDSAASFGLKKLTWANLKATAKTYFDTLYAKVGAIGSSGITTNTGVILGRTTASSGAVEEITVGTGLSLAAGTISNTVTATPFASSAENAAGTIENKAVDPLGIREAFNASGSAPVFACRAWVNFNGTGTIAIRSSGNVSSITDNGVGNYTVNFATAMQDANYAPAFSFDTDLDSVNQYSAAGGPRTAYTQQSLNSSSSMRVFTGNNGSVSTSIDYRAVNVAVYR